MNILFSKVTQKNVVAAAVLAYTKYEMVVLIGGEDMFYVCNNKSYDFLFFAMYSPICFSSLTKVS